MPGRADMSPSVGAAGSAASEPYSLPTAELRALALIYAIWEMRRFPYSRKSIDAHLAGRDLRVGEISKALDALLDRRFIEYTGAGEGDGREVQVGGPGIAWFERNVDYWRDCNIYRYKSRHAQVGCFTFDPRRSLASRLRDPVVPAATLFGAAFTAMLMWWLA